MDNINIFKILMLSAQTEMRFIFSISLICAYAQHFLQKEVMSFDCIKAVDLYININLQCRYITYSEVIQKIKN